MELARQQAWAGRAPDARQSLDKATSLELYDWLKVEAASVYRRLGDVEPAGRLAADASPSLAAQLAELGPDELDDGDRDWVSRLVEAWLYVGNAAVAAADTKKAERHLEAAWRLLFLPEAGWALGELREKQGRLADAVELWSMASVAAGPRSSVLPANRQKRIEAACAKLPDVGPPTPPRPPGTTGAYEVVYSEPARVRQARDRLMDLRTVRLKGPVVANVTEEVLLLTGTDGQVEVVRNVSGKTPEAFDTQLAKLGLIRLEWPRPDEHPLKTVRRGILSCYSASGCALVLDLVKQDQPLPTGGSIHFASLDPKEGSTLSRGQRVTVVATGRYQIHAEGASARLIVLSRSGEKAIVESERKTLSAGEGDVTFTATFTVPENAPSIMLFFACSAPGRSVASKTVAYQVR